MIKSYTDLIVWQRAYGMAMDIFTLASTFPKQETYSLTSQIIRSSRSVSANICEGWAKREYEAVFRRHIIDAIGSTLETENWLLFAKDCKYLNESEYALLVNKLGEIGRMLNKLHQNWKT